MVVESNYINTYGICALNQLNIQGPDNIQIFGDVASNGTISISTSQTSPAVILGDTNSPQKFTGKATAAGTITCAGGCATQVQGGVFSEDQIEAYLELKWPEVARWEMTPSPVEFDMYYSS